MKKIYFLFIIVLLFSLVFSACSNSTTTTTPEDTTIKYSDFYGIWANDLGFYVTIDPEEGIYFVGTGMSYAIWRETWELFENKSGPYTADFPWGYKMTGDLTLCDSFSTAPRRTDGSQAGALYETVVDYWYINNDKTGIRRGNYLAGDHGAPDGGYEFKKQH